MSSPFVKNISLPFFRTLWLSSHIPLPIEGRFAIVTNVGRGMRWTRRLQLTSEAEARQSHLAETGCADGEVVWSRSPDAGIKLSRDVFARAMVANKPGTPRRARSSR